MEEYSEIILYLKENKYKIIKQINKTKSSFGDIYLVKNLEDNKENVAKILKLSKTSISDINSFNQEITILNELSKNNNKNKYFPNLYAEGLGNIKINKEIIGEKRFFIIDYYKKVI